MPGTGRKTACWCRAVVSLLIVEVLVHGLESGGGKDSASADQCAEAGRKPFHLRLDTVGHGLLFADVPSAGDAVGTRVGGDALRKVGVGPGRFRAGGERLGSAVVIWPARANGSSGTCPMAIWEANGVRPSTPSATWTVPAPVACGAFHCTGPVSAQSTLKVAKSHWKRFRSRRRRAGRCSSPTRSR